VPELIATFSFRSLWVSTTKSSPSLIGSTKRFHLQWRLLYEPCRLMIDITETNLMTLDLAFLW